MTTDAETSNAKRRKFTDRFCQNRTSVACVMKVFHVVVSLHHLSHREVGHHLSVSLIFISSARHRHYEKTLKSSCKCFISGKLLRYTNKVSLRFLLRDTLNEPFFTAYQQGSVSRKSGELFGPEMQVVKLQSACFEKLIF